MNMSERFGQQCQANLREYRRQAPWRFLKLLIAFVLALIVGGSLHFAKNFPILFYFLIAVYGCVAAVMFVLKLAGVFGRTYDETRFIVYGEDTDGSRAATASNPGTPFPPSTYTPNSMPANPVASHHPANPFGQPASGYDQDPSLQFASARTPQGGGNRWLVALGIFGAVICSGCLGVPLLFFVAFKRVENPAARQPVPFNEPMRPGVPFPHRAEDHARRIEEQIQQHQELIKRQQETMRRDLERRLPPGK